MDGLVGPSLRPYFLFPQGDRAAGIREAVVGAADVPAKIRRQTPGGGAAAGHDRRGGPGAQELRRGGAAVGGMRTRTFLVGSGVMGARSVVGAVAPVVGGMQVCYGVMGDRSSDVSEEVEK